MFCVRCCLGCNHCFGFAVAPKLDDPMVYVQKLAARSLAHKLSTAGGAVLAGMDAPIARALAAQVNASRRSNSKAVLILCGVSSARFCRS